MEIDELLPLTFMPSRIPALDALVGFVQNGNEKAPWIAEATARTGQHRWYPMETGHRLVILYEGGPFDPKHLHVEKGAWDHEHCSRCHANIEPMTLCWVTESGRWVLLCEACHTELEPARTSGGG